jgi:hypothetical protein
MQPTPYLSDIYARNGFRVHLILPSGPVLSHVPTEMFLHISYFLSAY